MDVQYITLMVSLLASAFFSGMEIAFVSNNKLKVGLLKKQTSRSAKIISRFYNKQSAFLSTILIGNNIALVIFGITVSNFVKNQWFSTIEHALFLLMIETLITTFIVLFLGEFFPKILFQINPNRILKFFAYPFQLVNWLLFLPVTFVNGISTFLIKKVLKQNITPNELAYSKIDLENFVKSSTESKQEEEEINADLFEKALQLSKIKVRECMVPRPEIEAIEDTATLIELSDKFIETKHSRIVVYKETIDHVLGYVHHHDMLKKPSDIATIVLPIKVVTETMVVRNLMNEFIKERKSIAKVVDEFGGTAGIITLEDIIEEIFGEIEDEHDEPDFIERQIAVDEFIFSGRLEIDYLNEKYTLDLPEGEYETIAGYIFSVHENIPPMGEVIETKGFEISILSVSKTKIETIKLKKNSFLNEE